MTNHAVLAGSVLAGVALWAAVYTALLLKQAPARAPSGEASVASSVPDTRTEQLIPAPRRWVDLPREEPQPSALRVIAGKPSAADLPDADQPRTEERTSRRRLHRIRRAAPPEVLIEQRFVRERAHAPRRGRTRMRVQRKQEPIQFGLATRSSS